MGVSIYFSTEHAIAVSRSIEIAINTMYNNAPDDPDYYDILNKTATDLTYVKSQLDSYIEAVDYEQRLSGKL